MSLDNYDGLREEVIKHLDRSDLDVEVGTFIRLAEMRHQRDLRIRQMLKRAKAAIADRYMAVPDDFLSMRHFRLLCPVMSLQEVNVTDLDSIMQTRRCGSGRPRYYAVHDDIEFDREPDEPYTAEMLYYAAPVPLSDDNQTNIVLERSPDIYLYGALIAAEPFLANDERIETWAALYKSAVDSLNLMDQRKAGKLQMRVPGVRP